MFLHSAAHHGASYLPMSPKTIEVVKATAPVVAPLANKITEAFYPRLLGKNPAAWTFFNKTNQKKGLQQQALADAVVGYASNIDNLSVLGPVVAKIGHRHCALGVTPEFYQLVHDALMESIAEVLGDAVTPEIGEAWSNAVMALAEICINNEEELYKHAESRSGGWRGYKDFVLVNKTVVGTDTISFDFKAKDDKSEVGIDFTPGQYLSIRVPESGSEAPRHYTVTSKPGDAFLQCTIRHLKATDANPQGVVSSFMHTSLSPGDTVSLAPPFGVFTQEAALAGAGSNVKFVSAGIGLTLGKALSSAGIVSGLLHVDRSDGHTASIVGQMQVNGPKTEVYGKGRDEIMAAVKKYAEANVGEKDATYVMCGPIPFMKSAQEALVEGGVKRENIMYELFGTGSMK